MSNDLILPTAKEARSRSENKDKNDPNVVLQNTIKRINKAIEKGFTVAFTQKHLSEDMKQKLKDHGYRLRHVRVPRKSRDVSYGTVTHTYIHW